MKQKNDKCYCDQIFTVIMFNSGLFHATGVFLLPLENVKTSGFLEFSGGTEREQWNELR